MDGQHVRAWRTKDKGVRECDCIGLSDVHTGLETVSHGRDRRRDSRRVSETCVGRRRVYVAAVQNQMARGSYFGAQF